MGANTPTDGIPAVQTTVYQTNNNMIVVRVLLGSFREDLGGTTYRVPDKQQYDCRPCTTGVLDED